MTETYSRASRIERSEDGQIGGILATDGEASDGHILSIDGLQTSNGAPLLFGHDDYTGRSNLGSWTSFEKETGSDKLGGNKLRGNARIETDGVGSQAEFRADLLHMIEQGHIGQFSIRWDAIDSPVRRINLPKDHPAFVDAGKVREGDRKRWGLFFPRARMLEGSVVTLGADPKAIIGRMATSPAGAKREWGRAIMDMYFNEELDGTVESMIRELQDCVQALRDFGVEDFGTILRVFLNEEDEGRDFRSVVHPENENRRVLIPAWAHGVLMERAVDAFDGARAFMHEAVYERTQAAPAREVPEPEEVERSAESDDTGEPEAETPETPTTEQVLRSASASDLAQALRETNLGVSDQNKAFAATAIAKLLRSV